jgi:hypothetical protein
LIISCKITFDDSSVSIFLATNGKAASTKIHYSSAVTAIPSKVPTILKINAKYSGSPNGMLAVAEISPLVTSENATFFAPLLRTVSKASAKSG